MFILINSDGPQDKEQELNVYVYICSVHVCTCIHVCVMCMHVCVTLCVWVYVGMSCYALHACVMCGHVVYTHRVSHM